MKSKAFAKNIRFFAILPPYSFRFWSMTWIGALELWISMDGKGRFLQKALEKVEV